MMLTRQRAARIVYLMSKPTAAQMKALRAAVADGYIGTGSARHDTVAALARAGLVTMTSKVEAYRLRGGLPSVSGAYYIDFLARPTDAGRALVKVAA